MAEETKVDYHEHEFGEGIEDFSSCSATDCTGLQYRAPVNEEERKSYQEVYHYEPPFVRGADKSTGGTDPQNKTK